MIADLTLERALFRCILKPLKGQIDAALQDLHEQDGSYKRLADSMVRARENSPHQLFMVRVAVPDSNNIEKIKQKMALMSRVYSPIDKVVLLLQFCKLVYKAMKSDAGNVHSNYHSYSLLTWIKHHWHHRYETGQQFGADDFLPVLSYVMVQCNLPEILLQVEYMMELLDNSCLSGEGTNLFSTFRCFWWNLL